MGDVLAADLGGTKTTVGLVSGTGTVRHRRTLPTGAHRGPDAIVDDLAAALAAVRDDAHDAAPSAVGIGTAGVVDSARGRLSAATDAIPGWAGTELAERIAGRLGLATAVLNDVHAHALGEARHGAGEGAASLLLVAVGTGIGGGIVTDGRILTGHGGVAGGVGHLPVPEAEGLPCPCGRTGHLEGLASGPGTLAAYRRAGGEAGDTRAIVTRAEAGDTLAAETLTRSARAVGRVLGGLLNTLDPERVVLAGGMAGAGDRWWGAVRDGVAHDAMDAVASTPILPARTGPDAALLGAAHFARTRPA